LEYETVDVDTYDGLKDDAYVILNEASSLYPSKSPLNISVSDILHFFCNEYSIQFIGFSSESNTYRSKLLSDGHFVTLENVKNVDSIFTKTVDGFTVKKNSSYVIELNCDLPISRFTFTLLHELAHIKFHLNGKNTRLFKFNSKSGVNASNNKFENEANYIASTLFVSDEKLKYFFTNRYSYQEILDKTGMSNKALFNRIKNWLMYTIKMYPHSALTLLWEYRGSDPLLVEFLCKNYYYC